MINCMFFGNIGCGKTSWTRTLSRHGYNVAYEDLNQIPYLSDYWKKKANPFHTQVNFYAKWFDIFNELALSGGGFIDSSIISHHYVFSRYMFDSKLLDLSEFALCSLLCKGIMQSNKWQCVFLYCNYKENMKRIGVRSRLGENRSPIFIKELATLYNSVFELFKDSMVRIDVTCLDSGNELDCKLFLELLNKNGINLD